MAASFNGWLSSWGDSWGPQTFDPNTMVGAAGLTFTAIGALIAEGVLDRYNLFQDTSQGMAGKNKPDERNHYADFLNRQYERKLRVERDNRLATAFIMALLQTEILDG